MNYCFAIFTNIVVGLHKVGNHDILGNCHVNVPARYVRWTVMMGFAALWCIDQVFSADRCGSKEILASNNLNIEPIDIFQQQKYFVSFTDIYGPKLKSAN